MRWCIAPLLSLLIATLAQADEWLFDPDPQHVWNRLHRHFHVRTMPDGTLYSQESLEPVFVRRSTFLTDGVSHEQALRLLDEFLQNDAEKLIDDPLRRAILQRDLWGVFVTTADPSLRRQPQRRELQKRLAQVMRRVALSAEQIQRLPDNLDAAVRSGHCSSAYDPDQPDRPFLPDDLLQADGPWVLVRSRLRKDDLAAPLHVQATEGRSVFLLFIRLPEGRHAALNYLKTLKELPKGTEIPQIPIGTQVALLRRVMLIDFTGTLRLTPLTESLQVRVYQKLAAPDMYEFSLRRKHLFAERDGGLHPTGRDQVNLFDLGFLGFESHLHPDPLENGVPPLNSRRTPVVMESCVKCHAGPGIFGFQSMFAGHFDRPPLDVAELKSQVTPVIDGSQKTYAWGLLQGLWETEPSK